MDRYLKAHDDLQTVLRIYEGVLDGKETLPLRRTDGGGLMGGDAYSDTGEGQEGFGAIVGVDSSDDDSLVQGPAPVRRKGMDGDGDGDSGGGGGGDEGAGGDARARAHDSGLGGEAERNSSGRGSPAKGNLLDLEENAPLDMRLTGRGAGGMMVEYSGGQFSANHQQSGVGGGVGGTNSGAAGFDSTSSAAHGSTTASNFNSDTGAVYGSNTFGSNNNYGSTSVNYGSNNFGSNNFGSNNFGSNNGGVGGENGASFGEACYTVRVLGW